MHIAVFGVIMGSFLTSTLLLMHLSFLFAWLIATLIGIAIEIWFIKQFWHRKCDNSIAFWLMIGAVLPVYWMILRGTI